MSSDVVKCSQAGPSLSERVTVHRHHPVYKKVNKQPGKLILLPDSIQGLLKIGGKCSFYGRFHEFRFLVVFEIVEHSR
jgi:hypothetical protein